MRTLAEELGLTGPEAHAITRCACDLASAGHLQPARSLLEGLTFLNPLDASAWAALGAVAWRQGSAADAERALARALELDPRHPVALGTLRHLGAPAARRQHLQPVPGRGSPG